jgi:CheY-like chemotaxis protein
LGLSVSYGIVTNHQGIIHAENRPEGGAHFVVELPAVKAAEPAPMSELETPSAKPARILVVEDEEAVATMLARVLRADGHQVTVTAEGAAALTRLGTEPFDLIVTDFKMPGMSGLEFYRSVAETHPGLAHRIIFTTGDVLSVDTRRFLAEVGAPVLRKPYSLDQARSVIYRKLQEGET